MNFWQQGKWQTGEFLTPIIKFAPGVRLAGWIQLRKSNVKSAASKFASGLQCRVLLLSCQLHEPSKDASSASAGSTTPRHHPDC